MWLRRDLPRIDRPVQFRIALAEAHNLGLLKAREQGVPAQVLVQVERREALLEAERGWLDPLRERLEAEAEAEVEVVSWGSTVFTSSGRCRVQRKAAQQ